MTVEPTAAAYALELSEPERTRYREMAKRAWAQEGERWQRYGIVPGARVADVGCGPGAVTVQLAKLVAPGGSVVGVEPNASTRAAASNEIVSAGAANASIVDGTGIATTLAPGTFNVVMIRHVLFHVGSEVDAVLAHAVSLLCDGGHLYVVDTDGTGIRSSVADADYVEQSRRYIDFQRGRGNNVDIGPRLGPLLAAAGLELVEHAGLINAVPATVFAGGGGPVVAARHDMLAAGAISEDDARRYDEAIDRLAATPAAVLFVPSYLAVGRKR